MLFINPAEIVTTITQDAQHAATRLKPHLLSGDGTHASHMANRVAAQILLNKLK